MYIVTGAPEQPATLFWLSRDGINQATLVAVPDVAPSPSASPPPSPSASPLKATPKPTKKP
jgi:hypothetical protein